MFVDDIMILGSGVSTEWRVYLDIIKDFCKVSGLTINSKKSTLLVNETLEAVLEEVKDMFQVEAYPFDVGTRYLGYFIKPNDYKDGDWLWLLQIFDKRIKLWC